MNSVLYRRCATSNIVVYDEYKDKRFSSVLALMLVLSVYLIPNMNSISFGELVAFVAMIDVIVRKRKVRYYRNTWLLLFILYSVGISFLVLLMERGSISNTTTRILRDTFYYITIYVFGYSYLDYDEFVKWIKRICIVLSFYIISQEIIYLFTGYLIPGFLLNATVAKTNTAREIYNHTLVSAQRNGYLKANGFLTEGAHCAQALAIGTVSVYDFEKNDSSSLKLAVVFTIAGVMTFSASALFFSSLIWIAILISIIKQKKVNNRLGTVLIILFTGIIAFTFFCTKTNLSSVFNRLLSALSTTTADNSSFLRLYKGFIFWGGLPLANKILGIGFGNYSSLNTLYQGAYSGILSNEYMNTISYILVSSGIVGFSLFVLFLCGLFKSSNSKGKIIIFLLLFMSISSSPYSSTFWTWMVLLILSNRKGSI